MSYEVVIGIFLFSFVLGIKPGPNNAMLLLSGANYGFTRTLPHLLGVIVGLVAMFLATGFGLGGFFQLYPEVLYYLKLVALVYLLYLSWQMAFSKAVAAADPATARPLSFVQGFLFQWVNPKAWIVALTAMALYVDSSAPILSVLLISLIFGVALVPCLSVWAFFGKSLRSFLDDPYRLRVFNLLMGMLLVLAGIAIAFI